MNTVSLTQKHSIECPRKLIPLLESKRYKGAYGGRGGAKSHFFAEQIVIRAFAETVRVVCIREMQNSIKDSVKQLIIDKIAKFGLVKDFDVLDQEIRCKRTGSFIIFKGMQSYNAANIKSLEGFDIAWVEEAQTLSKHSLDMLRPTIRKEDLITGKESELWFSWNPRFKTDPVDMFFRKSPPVDAISVNINWRDNPWFPRVLAKEMLHDFETDPDNAEHVWNGAYGAGQGAILARWVNKAEREGRIHDVDIDAEAPIYISSDLGYRDTAAFWFWQPKIKGFSLIDYDQDTGQDADDWIPRLQNRVTALGAKLGKVWLPHDARVKTFQSKHSTVEKFLTAFGSDKIEIVPISKKSDQISAARTVIEHCEFHKTRCEQGLDGLAAWEFDFNEETGILSREPVHNWASHMSDSFAYGCQMMQELVMLPKDEAVRYYAQGTADGTIQTATIDELWESTPKRRNRI